MVLLWIFPGRLIFVTRANHSHPILRNQGRFEGRRKSINVPSGAAAARIKRNTRFRASATPIQERTTRAVSSQLRASPRNLPRLTRAPVWRRHDRQNKRQ